jgi:spore maturation protein CgeB
VRIFYASHASGDSAIPHSRTWSRNILAALIDLGHEIVPFDYDLDEAVKYVDPQAPEAEAYIAKNRPRMSEELVRQVRRAQQSEPLDLFFSYFYSASVYPEAIREISRIGIPTVNWYCNASYQFHLVSEIAPAYDICLVPERFRLKDYQDIGANPVYCQEAANPNVYLPNPDLRQDFDLTFVGQRYGDRPMFIRSLWEGGFRVQVWGTGWVETREGARRSRLRRAASRTLRRQAFVPHSICGAALNDREYVDMYSRSRISLGFSKVAAPLPGGAVVKQVRLRDFEAPMSGAFYLVEHTEELEDFFVPDKEIVCFESTDDMLEKAEFYLRNDRAREAISRAGLLRARREHTWQARLTDAFERAGLQK